jgi:hypothetical protein
MKIKERIDAVIANITSGYPAGIVRPEIEEQSIHAKLIVKTYKCRKQNNKQNGYPQKPPPVKQARVIFFIDKVESDTKNRDSQSDRSFRDHGQTSSHKTPCQENELSFLDVLSKKPNAGNRK